MPFLIAQSNMAAASLYVHPMAFLIDAIFIFWRLIPGAGFPAGLSGIGCAPGFPGAAGVWSVCDSHFGHELNSE